MIIAERKPLEEIKKMILPYRNVMITGCDTCVNICWAGGENEVRKLAELLSRDPVMADIHFVGTCVERQCEKEMVDLLAERADSSDAILSLGCGAGVQVMADAFDDKPVIPALNTTFLGIPTEPGVWVENCAHCGDCVLDRTGGICPVARCAKGLQNGPCGGVRKGGKCEVDPEKNCAWVDIYSRLNRQNRLDVMRQYREPKNHRAVIRPGIIRAADLRNV